MSPLPRGCPLPRCESLFHPGTLLSEWALQVPINFIKTEIVCLLPSRTPLQVRFANTQRRKGVFVRLKLGVTIIDVNVERREVFPFHRLEC